MKEGMRLFFTGPFVKVELLEVMLGNHGIGSRHEFVDEALSPHDDELSRPTRIYVPEADYARAYELFFTADWNVI